MSTDSNAAPAPTRSQILPLAFVLAACLGSCGKKKTNPPPRGAIGEPCRVPFECESTACADRICVSSPRKSEESCAVTAKCAEGMTCYASAKRSRLTYRDKNYEPSFTYGDVCRTREGIAEFERREQKKAARKQLEGSGLSRDHVRDELNSVESRPAPTGAGLPVRVVRTEGVIQTTTGAVLAACRRDERLTGGSCSPNRAGSGPSLFSKTDTVGARWSCPGKRSETVVAHALCQTLPRDKRQGG